MNKIRLSTLFLLVSLYGFSQTHHITNTSFVMANDMDDDGMDDDWEISNGLDPNNPKDAWADADNDTILNLFEFQLETDPNDENRPVVSELRPVNASSLDPTLRQAENSIRVIRLSQGNYNAIAAVSFRQNFKVMFQGGWNDDFTEHNPDLYPTNWYAEDFAALSINAPEPDSEITNLAVILEGINFSTGHDFSIGGPVAINPRGENSSVCIYNCTFNSNPAYGLSLGIREHTELSQFFFVNSVIGNNSRGGIYVQVSEGTKSRWRFLNTTINNPESEYGGIYGYTEDMAELKVELTNSINWGNTNYSFNFEDTHNVPVSTTHSNIDEAAPSVVISDLGNSINEDPKFKDVMADDWTLTEGSPCIDTGVDVGLSFNGSAPDMGALETIDVSNTKERNSFESINISPNPFNDNFLIEIDEANWEEAEIKIYDVLGKCLHSEKRVISGKLNIDTKNLSKGLFILTLKVDEQQYASKILKN